MKRTKSTIITAVIDTSEAKLDIAVHGAGSAFTVTNDEAGWRTAAVQLVKSSRGGFCSFFALRTLSLLCNINAWRA
ncbi:MAG TPA: hypothetical protein PK677_13080 [Acidiphilium sp.]|nr:hypothetical protein [Acidiphilium sp.]HQU25190.1 hypothetical protein [Acidiphilium sp.]